MKLAYRSPILRDSVPGSASLVSSTIACTSFSACSAVGVGSYDRLLRASPMRMVSFTFIWQPNVRM